MSDDALVARLRSQDDELLKLVERLVRVNSHTRNVPGVDAVGALLVEALPFMALQTQQPEQLGKHLCFSTSAASAQPILLIGHHDTVFPQGTFEGYRREGDLAFGPGVLDMKGGLAIVCTVLRVLHEAGTLHDLPLRFVSVSDEEIGSPTSQDWLRELAYGARCALVFEAGRAGDLLITARRGSGSALVTATGKAAHAGNALSEGKNAIWALARFIDRAQGCNGTIPGASLNVGLVRGGTARNTVPDHATCELDLRFSEPAGEEALRHALGEAAHDAAIDGAEVQVAITVSRSPWARSKSSAALCATFGAHQQAAGLLAGEAPVIGGGSDANTVGALGVPTLDGLGPRGRGFHTLDEQIEVSSLGRKAEALLRFLLSQR